MVHFRRQRVRFWAKAVDMSLEGREKPFNEVEISVMSCKTKSSWMLRKIQKDKNDFGSSSLVLQFGSCQHLKISSHPNC